MEAFRLNLWLHRGLPPLDGAGLEIVVTFFGHTPLESVGEVPDGGRVAGAPLTLSPGHDEPGTLRLEWGPSCGTAATDYGIYEGSLESLRSAQPYDHTGVLCSTEGEASGEIVPASGSVYYLVVPQGVAGEGLYGVDSQGRQRPVSGFACAAHQVTTPCPAGGD